MAVLVLVNLVLGMLNILIGGFTLREKWRARRPPSDPAADVIALRDIAAAIRELRTS